MSADTTNANVSRRSFMMAGAAAVTLPFALGAAPPFPMPDAPMWEQTTDRKTRIGVVGGGFGASFHWHEHPNCTVAAVSDLLPDRREHLKRTYKCDKAYDSLEELILDPQIDAVAVFTPAPDHARHVIACFEHGKHAISACPACITLEEAEQLKEAKERTGLKYMNAETSYFHPETILMRRLVADGALGALPYSEAEYYHPGIGRTGDGLSWRDGKRTWRYGFPPMLYPTHTTAFLVGVTRERLVKVSCIGTTDPDEPSMKDNDYNNPFLNGTAMFQTCQGNAFRGNVCWNVNAHGERAQWFGSEGVVYTGNWAGQPVFMEIRGQRYNSMPDFSHMLPTTMRYDSGHGGSHPHITHEFVTALVEDREPAIDIYEALSFCVPGIVAHQSSLRGGEQLTIPRYDKPA